jgi:hypothetical protein
MDRCILSKTMGVKGHKKTPEKGVTPGKGEIGGT